VKSRHTPRQSSAEVRTYPELTGFETVGHSE
jgi:hypothetical protein